MGCDAGWSGTLKVNTRLNGAKFALDEALKFFREHEIHTTTTELGGGIVEFSICGEAYMGYSSASEGDDKLKELSPFVTEPALVQTTCEGDESEVFVGKRKHAKATISKNRLAEIMSLLEFLTPEDKAKLAKRLGKKGVAGGEKVQDSPNGKNGD